MRSSGARAACAAILMVLSIIAVISLNDGTSVVRATSSAAAGCKDPPCLSAAERAEVKAAGEEAEESTVKEKAELAEAADVAEDEADAKALKKAKEVLAIEHGPHYGSNCLTLKAYAISSYDSLMDLRKGSVNVLKPILRVLAESPEANNTKEECEATLDYALTTLSEDPDIMEESGSIARAMINTIADSMTHGRGILMVGDLADSGTACSHTDLDRRDCVEAAHDRQGGQFIFIDAERVGWSGEPAVFQHLAVRSVVVDHAAREMAKTTEAKEYHPLAVTYQKRTWTPTEEQSKIFADWDGKLV